MPFQFLNLKAKGLFTHPNPFSEVPPGALLEASNVVIDREGIIENRIGFNPVFWNADDGTIYYKKMFDFGVSSLSGQDINYLIFLDSNDNFNYTDFNTSFGTVSSPTYYPPSGATAIRDAKAHKNLYLSTH